MKNKDSNRFLEWREANSLPYNKTKPFDKPKFEILQINTKKENPL